MDVLPQELLKRAESHLLSAPGFISSRCPPLSQLLYDELGSLGDLSLDDPLQTIDPSQPQFDEAAKEISYEAQVELFIRHQQRSGLFPDSQALGAKLVAARWCYLLLGEFGMLGSKQSGGWLKADHDVAWRTVFGNSILKGQQLSKKKIPATVRRLFSRRVEKLYDLPKADESFRDLLRFHELRARYSGELFQDFQMSQSACSDGPNS